MKTLWEFLGFCKHDWVDQGVNKIFDLDSSQSVPIKILMRQRCTKCGKYRQLKML